MAVAASAIGIISRDWWTAALGLVLLIGIALAYAYAYAGARRRHSKI
ncbi:type IV secretory pathway TrbD component [Nakamurella sp. UYEF19]